MSRKYFTLAVREDGRWSPQFGAYDRTDVDFERQDYRDHGTRAADLRIITTSPRQSDINAAIEAL